MKIKSKFNLVLGILLLAGDLWLLYNGIFEDISQGMVWYGLIAHFGAMAFAYELESEYIYTVPFMPWVIMFQGNMEPEWKKKYDWIFHIPVYAFVLLCIAAWIFL